MPIRTWVGRFAIVQGQAQEEGPWLRSFTRQRTDEEGDELFVLAEPALPGSEEYCGGLVDAVGRLYREENLSVTGAILRSLQSAHQQLRDWNQRSLRQHQVAAGVSCVAVRGRTAYLAQAGPSVAYHVANGSFERVVGENGANDPVGVPELLDPDIRRYQLAPGDLLLIASPRLAALVDDDALRPMLQRGAQDALPELFRMVRDQQDFALLMLACVSEPDEADAPPPQFRGPAPTLDATPPEAVASAVTISVAAPPVGPAGNGAPPAVEPAAEPEAVASMDGDGAQSPAAEAAADVNVAETIAQEPPPTAEAVQEDLAASSSVDLSGVKVRLRGDEANVHYPRTTGWQARLPNVPPLFIIGALLLVIAGVAAYCAIPPALEDSRKGQFDAAMDDAWAAFTAAQSSTEPAGQRELLTESQTKLAEAQQIDADDPAVSELEFQLAASLAQLNAILELPAPQTVVNLSERVPGPLAVTEVAIGGGGAYFLDREQGRVVATTLLAPNPEPFVLFAPGTQVGSDLAGRAEHMVWAEGVGLLVLDDARRLFAISPGVPPRLLTVRDAATLGSADGLAYAANYLYVLDREGDQVWRYQQTDNGFDSERDGLLLGRDLDQAVEIAIGNELYVVMEDGMIAQFSSGQESPFALAGIDKELADPGSPVFLPVGQRLMIADRGNKRVVVASADGTFRQQLTSAGFPDVRAIAVDEVNNLLYVLSGTSLLQTPLPPAPPVP